MNRYERIYKLKNGSDTAVWAANEIERLDSMVERLRKALNATNEPCRMYYKQGMENGYDIYSNLQKALDETPEQSLAEIRAEAVERSVSKTPEHKMKVDNRIYHSQRALLDFAAAIRQEADL